MGKCKMPLRVPLRWRPAKPLLTPALTALPSRRHKKLIALSLRIVLWFAKEAQA